MSSEDSTLTPSLLQSLPPSLKHHLRPPLFSLPISLLPPLLLSSKLSQTFPNISLPLSILSFIIYPLIFFTATLALTFLHTLLSYTQTLEAILNRLIKSISPPLSAATSIRLPELRARVDAAADDTIQSSKRPSAWSRVLKWVVIPVFKRVITAKLGVAIDAGVSGDTVLAVLQRGVVGIVVGKVRAMLWSYVVAVGLAAFVLMVAPFVVLRWV